VGQVQRQLALLGLRQQQAQAVERALLVVPHQIGLQVDGVLELRQRDGLVQPPFLHQFADAVEGPLVDHADAAGDKNQQPQKARLLAAALKPGITLGLFQRPQLVLFARAAARLARFGGRLQADHRGQQRRLVDRLEHLLAGGVALVAVLVERL